MLRLVHRTDEEFNFSDNLVGKPVLDIPDGAYKPHKESLKSKRTNWAKEQGAKQVAKKSINEATHWLTNPTLDPMVPHSSA